MRTTLFGRAAVVVLVCACCVTCLAGEDAQAYLMEARRAMRDRDWKTASKRYLKAVGADPSNADIHAELGVAYLNLDNLTAAESRFKKALSLDDRNATAKIGLSRIYARKGDQKKALEYLREGRQLCRRAHGGQDARGPAAIQKQMLEAAKREFKGSTKTEVRDLRGTLLSARQLSRAGQYQQAIDLLLPAIKTNPDAAMLYVQLGVAYHGQGNRTEAKEALNKAIDLSKEGDPAAALARSQLVRMGYR